MKKLLLLPLLLLAACQLGSTSPTPPANTKYWSSPASWPGNQLPGPDSSVVVEANQTLVLDTDTAVKNITVLGTLVFADKDLSLTTEYLMVHGPGTLQIGTADKPYTHKATLTLIGNNPTQDIMGMGSKFIAAMMGGKLEIYGQPRVSWSKLNATAAQGANRITLLDPVDWQVGESIVVASTDLEPSRAEQRKITAVSSDKLSVSLDSPLDYAHYGELQTFGGKTLDERAEVGLLSRNIVIQSSADSTAGQFGGHVMVMGSDASQRETNAALSSSAHVRGVEFRRMGQYQILGRYPFHWHRNGQSQGNFIEGSSFHDNFQRAIVVHSTDNATVKDNVVFASVGHSFMTEDGSETGNLFEHNLGINTQAFGSEPTNPVQAKQNDTQAATFWIKGPNNRFIGNAAAGGEHSAFWFDSVGPVDQSKFEFRDNVAHSYKVGRQVIGTLGAKGAIWVTGTSEPQYSFHGPFVFSNLTVYKSREGYWANPENDPTGSSSVDINNSIFADNSLATSSHGLRDSVIVGKSANPDTDALIGKSGVQEYQASSYVKNVQFFNFAGNTSAFVSRNCFRDGGSIVAENIQINNAQLRLCPLGNNDMAIFDKNGQIAGNGVPSTVVDNTSTSLYDSACALNAASNSRVCLGLLQYLNLTLETDRFYLNQITAGSAAPDLTRDDGRVLSGQNDILNKPFYWTLIKGHSYTLSNDAAHPNLADLSSWQYLRFRVYNKYLSDGGEKRAVIVSVPSQSSNFTASSCALEPSQTGLNCANKTMLASVASLDELNASPSVAYFYDAPAAVVRLKLISSSDTSVLLERGYQQDKIK